MNFSPTHQHNWQKLRFTSIYLLPKKVVAKKRRRKLKDTQHTLVTSIRIGTHLIFLINLFCFCFSFGCHSTWHTSADDELAHAINEAEAKAPEDLTEHDKMALLGRPKAGDIVRAQLRIKESKEFKVSVSFHIPHSFFIHLRVIVFDQWDGIN